MKPLDSVAIALVLAASIGSSAWALSDERLNGQLMKLDPATRLEQTCDTEVMERLNRDNRKLSVDKVMAYAFGDPVVDDNTLNTSGAVFRSRGQWYRLTYSCRTGPRHLDAHMLDYDIGDRGPRIQWRQHYLYD